MDSLKGYIGLAASIQEVDSGLYINQLPGVSLDMMDGLVEKQDSEQVNIAGLWDEVENRALLKIRLAIKAKMNEAYQLTDNTVFNCVINENVGLFSIALWYFLGVELMIERTSSDRLNRYTTIDLEKAEKLKGEYYAEFQAALMDAVNSIDYTSSECITGCLEYAGPVRFVEQTP